MIFELPLIMVPVLMITLQVPVIVDIFINPYLCDIHIVCELDLIVRARHSNGLLVDFA
jgi:hypothetical protein